MKKRKWQKAAALIACVTMVATTPNITNVVNGSAYDDGNIADFISAEDSGADNSWNGTEDFSQNENGQAPDSVDFISGFSSEDSLFPGRRRNQKRTERPVLKKYRKQRTVKKRRPG